jgi:hypothetical protein
MSATANPTSALPARPPLFAFLRGFRIIPRIDKYPLIVAFAQTFLGKATLLALFGYLLYFETSLHYLHNPRWRWQLTFLVIITAFPKCRRILVTVGTLLWVYGSWWKWTDHPLHPLILQVAIVLAFAAALFWMAIRFRDSWFGRRPVATWLTGFALTVLAASYLPRGTSLRNVSWEFLAVAGTYVWFIAYSLLDVTSKSRDSFPRQLGTYQPFWGSTNTPFPKGAAYLRRIEAKNPEQLAISQLKGLKLLAWAIVLDLFMTYAFTPFLHGYLGIPFYEFAFYQSVHRLHFSCYMGWASLISEFLETMLALTIVGHTVIAVCRMAGFLALRNTYRPLSSRTLAEFWNRYYYYFKELLVDCFFYPTFMRYFKNYPRWRLFAATFAAAGFGNAFFHFFRDLNYIDQLGFWRALAGYQSSIFYMTVLAIGIGISQVRQREVKNVGWIRDNLLPMLSVTSFFCILRVFDYTHQRYPISESFRFLGHLLNLVH